MTIADKLNYLNDTKQAIKQAITDKGVDVLETDTFRSYADKIASIEAGGGSGADYKSSLMVTTTQSAYSPSIVSLSDYVLPDYTIKKEQTGLLYPKRTTTVETENFAKVGNVVVEDKVVSTFSMTDYLSFANAGVFDASVPWVVKTKVYLTSIDPIEPEIVRLGNSIMLRANRYNWKIIMQDSSKILFVNAISSSTWDLNTWYWLEMSWDGFVYRLNVSTNGLDYTNVISVSSSVPAYNTTAQNILGSDGATYTYIGGSGRIDLSETEITQNGSLWWQPYTIKETDEYDSSNIEKIGSSISRSDSNFVSGFDFNNYLKFTHNLTEPIRNLDLIIKGRVSTDSSYQVGISVSGTSVGWAHWVKIYNSNKIGMLTVGNADSGGFTVLNGVDYWFRCVGTENTFTLYCKRYDGLSIEETKNQEDWTQVFQTSLDKCIGQGVNTFEIGRNYDSSYSNQYWRGGFDLKNFQFIINDEIVCGYNRYLKGICTKDFIPQAGTNTLNAYHIEYTDGTSECLLGQTEPTGEEIKSVRLLESGLTFEEDKAWTYNEDSEQFE